MTTAELIAAGERIYGVRWQAPLARTLGVNIRTIQRWAVGQNLIPERIAVDVAALEAIALRRREHGA